MKKFVKILFIFFLSFFLVSGSYADTFKLKRVEAIEDYNNKEIILAFNKLKKLFLQGDREAAFVIGRLLKDGKYSIRDFDQAFEWFEKAAKMCHEQALEYLKVVYLKRGSPLFQPVKYDYLKKKCNDYKIKLANLKSTKSKKKKVSSKNNLRKNKSTFNENLKNSWEKIRPIKNDLKKGGYGSGFAISEKGHFLTNYHVISDCKEVDIYYNRMLGTGKVLASNKKMDTAIVKVDAITPFYLKFDTEKYVVGEELYAAGYPFTTNLIPGSDFSPTLKKGMLINTKVINSNWLLVDIPFASGNSGGPIINKYGLLRGQVTIGVNVKKLIQKNIGEKGIKELFAENIVMNIIISSIKLKVWINNTNIAKIKTGKRNLKFESDEIGKIATKTVGLLECFK